MSLVFGLVYKCDNTVMKVCDSSQSESTLGSEYFGYMTSDTFFNENWVEETILHPRISRSDLQNQLYLALPSGNIYANGIFYINKSSFTSVQLDQIRNFFGYTGFITSGSNRYGCILEKETSTKIMIRFLEYESTWSNSIQFSSIRVGGYCSFKTLVSSAHYTRFGTSSGYGAKTSLKVYVGYGEFNDIPSFDVRPYSKIVGISLGVENTFVDEILGITDYPKIFLGNRDTLPTTPANRWIRMNIGSSIINFEVIGHSSTFSSLVSGYTSSLETFDSNVDNLFIKNYGVNTSSTNGLSDVGYTGLVWTNERIGTNTSSARKIVSLNSMNGLKLNRFTSSSWYFYKSCIGECLIEAGNYGITMSGSGQGCCIHISKATLIRDVSLSTISDGTDSALNILSPSENTKVIIDSLLVVGFTNILNPSLLNYDFKNVSINNLAVQNVTNLNLEHIDFNNLYELDSDSQIFKDPSNNDYEIIDPTLLRIGIGFNAKLPDSILRLGDK